MPERHDDSVTDGEETNAVNRRQFVRSVGSAGGVAVVGSGFTAAARATPPSNPRVRDPEPVRGNQLGRLVRSVSGEPDIVNLMGREWAARVRRSAVTGLTHDDRIGPSERPQTQYKLEVEEEEVTIVGAAKHELDDGNEMTATAFVNENEAIFHYEYDDRDRGVKSKAKLWEVTGAESMEDVRLITTETSVNGEVTRSPTDFPTASGCSGCDPGPAPGGYRLKEECDDLDLGCAARGCGSCAVACTTIPTCIACLGIYCPFVIATCCNEHSETCERCAGMA